MKFTPSSTACLATPAAAAHSAGPIGSQPVSRSAPKPSRRTVSSPPIARVLLVISVVVMPETVPCRPVRRPIIDAHDNPSGGGCAPDRVLRGRPGPYPVRVLPALGGDGEHPGTPRPGRAQPAPAVGGAGAAPP